MTAVSPTRILVVDDDPWMLFLMRTLLDLLPGAEVIGEAHDGEEALRLVAARDPDVALLDIQMPGLDGLTAAEVIRSRWPSVRVVLHTGAYQDDRTRAVAQALAIPVYDKATITTTIETALLAGRARHPARDRDGGRDDEIDALVRMALTGRSNQALVIVSAGGTVVFYNSAAAALLDLPVPAQPVDLGKLWASTAAVWPDGRPRLPHERPLGIALATKSPARDDVIQLAADGTQRHLSVTAVPFFAAGQMIGAGNYINEIRREPLPPATGTQPKRDLQPTPSALTRASA